MFTKGQRVKWTSQSSGFVREKIGTIVRVVKRGETPWKIHEKEFPGHRRLFDGWSVPGNAQYGYLIEVPGGKTSRAKPKLYMPFPDKLELAKSNNTK